MADPISTDIAMVDVRRDGDRWRGFITPPWFRYFVASNPDGFGTGAGLLHGNPSGPPTWGPVDLATEVSGVLPVAHGGLGGLIGTIGGLLFFSGLSAFASTAAGTTHQVLHGGGAGSPTWAPVDILNDTTGILPVLRGGTGVTTSTGSGSNVLNNAPTILNPTLSNTLTSGFNESTCALTLEPDIAGGGLGQQNGQVISQNCRVVAINNAGVTALLGLNWGTFFILHDKTSGGMAFGVMDAIGGITVAVNTMVGVAITQNAISKLLQAQVTAGASPRNISVMGLVLKTP